MLLRFTSPDILNTSLFDVSTGQRAYEITTEVLSDPSEASSSQSTLFSPTASVVGLPSDDGSSTAASSGRSSWDSSDYPEARHTRIVNACGNVIVNVMWRNGRPSGITIDDEIVGGLNELFGSSAVPFMPKKLSIPTRFDSEFVWHATEDSLNLYDYATKSVRGTFHQNCIRIPTPLKSSKSKPTPSSKSLRPKPSKLDLSSSLSSPSVDEHSSPSSPLKSAFIPAARLPGLGSDYLEFESHPLAHDAEIVLSFLMMEILRRGRFFQLTPYTWDSERPVTRWHLMDATKGLFLRRGSRRNTV